MQPQLKISMTVFYKMLWYITFLVSILVSTTWANAQSLSEALISAYNQNPSLEAQRAQQRATDEDVSRALSGYRPTISLSAEASASYGDVAIPTEDELRSWGYTLSLRQSIFRGFRTYNAVREAETNVKAGQQDLISTEQTVLLNSVTAYMNVIRDQATLRLQNNNVKFLRKELQATQDRFDQGAVTRTDVAQAQARKAGAISQMELAKSNLKTSRAIFEQLIGQIPNRLREPKLPNRLLPKSLKSALKFGLAKNPSLQAAIFREESSIYNIDKIVGELLPEVTLELDYENTYFDTPLLSDTEDFRVLGRVTVPLYQSGDVSARARQAHQTNINLYNRIHESRRQVNSDIISAWSNLEAEKESLKTDLSSIKANKIALAGVKAEKNQGQRTLLDVLNAEQELLNAQVSLVETKRDIIVAAYTLLRAMGKLTLDQLNLKTELYDPEYNYKSVRGKLLGTDIGEPWRKSILPKAFNKSK